MKIGKYTVRTVETGTFGLDGGAMFGIIPKPLWQRTNPSDDANRITLKARCLLLKSESKTILVDTGIGSGWDDKFMKIYKIDQSQNTLFNSLKELSIEPGDITDVILTHLHFDHTGGSVILENGKWLPAFHNARYHVQKKQYDWASNPSDRDRGSFIQSRFQPLMDEGVLNLLEGEQFFDDEIELLLINGHTFSQQILKLSDSSNTFLYCADLIPTSGHIPVPYVMGYDLQPVVTVHEKQKYLRKAVEEDYTIIFEHDPVSAGAKIISAEKGFKLQRTIGELD